ncbi:hypothetical protein RD792_006215 [Penstemon davidsonii]|uniref:t-SNARE coiled-coil homology domain-containing protein n=1 Tax=Penstemon davidsonii TaxID=160366 RepID=A0ABR0DD91_9LAMI|nr:hypothetical protein RD792_006215 [Penstemon davidsonii]
MASMKSASSISANISSIPVLSGTNYKKWREHVMIVLGCMDLDHALRVDRPAAQTSESTADQKTAFEKWEQSNRMSLMIMKLSIFEISTVLSKLVSMRYKGKGNIHEYMEEEERLKLETVESVHLASTSNDPSKKRKRNNNKGKETAGTGASSPKGCLRSRKPTDGERYIFTGNDNNAEVEAIVATDSVQVTIPDIVGVANPDNVVVVDIPLEPPTQLQDPIMVEEPLHVVEVAPQPPQMESNFFCAWNSLTKLQHSVVQKKLQLQKEKLEMKLNYILQSQVKELEIWGNMEREHLSAVSVTKDYLHAVVCKIPLVDGAKVEPHSVSVAIRHASDLATSISLMINTFSPTVEKTVEVVVELAKVVTQEKLLLEEFLELFRILSALEVQMDDLEAGAASSTATESADLDKFFDDVENVKKDMNDVEKLYKRLQESNEETKTAHNAKTMKELRSRMDSDVSQVLKRVKVIKTKLEGLDKSNAAHRRIPGCGPGSSTDRTRTSVVRGLGKKLKDMMDEFQGLRARMNDEYKETVARRYFTVTGEKANDELIDNLISSGESESFLQKAIQEQGRGQIMDTISEIQERHDAVKEIEKNLLELHQIFLDMAALVEAQGQQLNNIESHVAHASSFVRRGTEQLQEAREYQKSSRKCTCIAIGLIILAIILFTFPLWSQILFAKML